MTNSGLAVFDGRQVSVLPIDPAAPNPRVARTALYLTTEQGVTSAVRRWTFTASRLSAAR